MNPAPLFLPVLVAVPSTYLLVFQALYRQKGCFKRPENNAFQVIVLQSQARTGVKAELVINGLLAMAWRELIWFAPFARQAQSKTVAKHVS